MRIFRETIKRDVLTGEVEYSNKTTLFGNADINDWRSLEDKILLKVKRSSAGTPAWYKQGNRIEASMRNGKTFLFRLAK